MINANEIRIGNWVDDAFTGYMQVTAEDLPNWKAINCLPIPLTPEILDKCGFIVQELPVTYADGMDGYKICIMRSANRWLMLTGKSMMIARINEDDNIYKGASIGSYKYLHQLQNLIYALTGEELPVTL